MLKSAKISSIVSHTKLTQLQLRAIENNIPIIYSINKIRKKNVIGEKLLNHSAYHFTELSDTGQAHFLFCLLLN